MTLAELAVASAVMVLVLISTLGVLGRSFRYVADMRRASQASQILQQKMEDLRLLTWTQLQALPSTFSDPGDTNNLYRGTIATSTYTSFSGTPTVMEVSLSLTWTNTASRAVTNRLTSLIGYGGVNQYFF